VTEVFEKLLISDFDSEDFDVEYYIEHCCLLHGGNIICISSCKQPYLK